MVNVGYWGGFGYSSLMRIQLINQIIEYGKLRGHSFMLLPVGEAKGIAVFAHGYTAHKGNLLSWASRLCEEGMACVIFDLPGHYLGGSLCRPSFIEFCRDAHFLFINAINAVEQCLGKGSQLVLGGHSLGGLLALKALALPALKDYKKSAVVVGLGLAPIDGEHIFNTNFYKSTLHLRSQLIVPELCPDNMFPWIKREKEKLQISGERIHLIVGEDDRVVGKDGAERLLLLLQKNANKVSLERPGKLAHHVPEQAASFVKRFLQSENII